MTDFSGMVFEERVLEDGMREIRIVAPAGIVWMAERRLVGSEARKRLIRYVFANVAAMVPHLAQELERECGAIHQAIEYADKLS